MEKFLRVLKNWWFAIIGFIAIILDQGFEVLNPFLIELGASVKAIGILKLVFGLYGIYRLKKSLPTQNPDKLKEIINNTVAEDPDPNPIDGGGVINDPPGKTKP